MAIDFINAAQAYGKTSSLSQLSESSPMITNPAENFFSELSRINQLFTQNPTEISSNMIVGKSNVDTQKRDAFGISDVFDSLRNAENQNYKALFGQASPADVVTAIKEAEVALQNITTFRNEVIKAYNQVINNTQI